MLISVGVGQRTESGWQGGGGLIPADMFDPAKHTKLSIDGESKLTIETDGTVHKVILDCVTIAECRDPYWAKNILNAIKRGRYA